MSESEAAILNKIAERVKNYRGLTRKAEIGYISSLLAADDKNIIAAKGEDGAILKVGKKKIVFAADGIIEDLIDANPEWAGYCSILVNVNDMLAMHARPFAAVNVISSSNRDMLLEIIIGMKKACDKFNIKMVGGHLHPDSSHNSISVAMIGTIVDDMPLLSTSAKSNEKIIVICDCRGEFTEGIPYSWDCTSKKSKKEIEYLIEKTLKALSRLNSGKDISNPGLLGTLGMLLESSGIGAEVDIGDIPQPSGVDLIQWLTTYHGLGFVGTAPESAIERIAIDLRETCLSVSSIGQTIKGKKVKIKLGNHEKVLFDFSKEKITGLY